MEKDTSEYSPTKSPETKRVAEEGSDFADPRLIPGGAEPRTPTEQGMSALDHDAVPSRAGDTGQTRYRDTVSDEVTGE
jgi:hypothetical protein